MKRKFSLVVAILLALALVLAACGGSGGDAGSAAGGSSGGGKGQNDKVYEFDFNNLRSQNNAQSTDIILPWVQLVEEKTNGRVKINVHYNGALGKQDNIYHDLSNGLYDFAIMNTQAVEETENHLITVGDLPLIASGDIELDTKVITEYYNRHKDEVLKDVVVMAVATTPYYHLLSTVPLQKAEDLKGLTIRAGVESEAALYKDGGMVPVDIPPEERYDALHKGIIKAIGTAKYVAVDSRYYEVAKYMYTMPFKTFHQAALMNKASFESLPEDLQKIFTEELFPALADLMTKGNVKLEDQGHEQLAQLIDVTDFPAEEFEKLKAMAKSSEDAGIKNAEKRGLNGAQLVQEYKDIQKQLSGK